MKNILSILLFLSFIPLYSQSPYPIPGRMSNNTVFAFSQYWLSAADTQVYHMSPDMVIRAWAQWDIDGTRASDYNFSVVSNYHLKNIGFTGGLTNTVYFYDQARDSATFKDMVTRDASGNLVPHNAIDTGAFRGNIANPAFRQNIINIAKLQIDGGVDGIFFDEAINGYDGSTYNGNEGFDDYTLKDFNAYLAAKYPNYQQADWISNFGMTDTNFINAAQPLNDLVNNFNYREYLSVNGWQSNPLTSSNPLEAEWGRILDGRADTLTDNFLDKYTTLYWRDIITQVREYARSTYGKEILITSNGLLPYVDYQSVGMYDYNQDNNGSQANYVPVSGSNLDGTYSLQAVFKSLYQRSAALAGSAPVILFIDWPTTMMSNYSNFPLNQKQDYWQIYAAEAYANGLFPSFHLRTSISTDPTAVSEGILDFITSYSRFYRMDSSYYHNNQILTINPSISVSQVNSSVMYQQSHKRYSIHLVNHNYIIGTGITPQSNFTVSIPLDSVPNTVYLSSPDISGIRLLNSSYNNGVLTINVENLKYYNMLVLDYSDSTFTSIKQAVTSSTDIINVFPNPSEGTVTIEMKQTTVQSGNICIYDELGRTVKTMPISNTPVNAQLQPGVYFIQCTDADTTYEVKKLIVR